MNMFLVDLKPTENAKMYCDILLRKMIVEMAQMLSTSHRILDGVKGCILRLDKKSKEYKLVDYNFVLRHLGENGHHPALYLMTHPNHPNTLWIRESRLNYQYAYSLFVALLDEYEYRFNKRHETSKLRHDLKLPPRNLKSIYMTPFVWDTSYQYIDNVTDAYKKIFIDKFREWSLSNAMIINGDKDAPRKRLIDISWTKRPTPSFIDDETNDMILTYHIKASIRHAHYG